MYGMLTSADGDIRRVSHFTIAYEGKKQKKHVSVYTYVGNEDARGWLKTGGFYVFGSVYFIESSYDMTIMCKVELNQSFSCVRIF